MSVLLLDTNHASFLLRREHAKLRERVRRASSATFAISVVTQAELLFGVARKRDAHQLERAVRELLRELRIEPWTEDAAERYATLRSSLESKGFSLGGLDMMIAAHALALQATLLTNDQAFKHCAELQVEDWTL